MNNDDRHIAFDLTDLKDDGRMIWSDHHGETVSYACRISSRDKPCLKAEAAMTGSSTTITR